MCVRVLQDVTSEHNSERLKFKERRRETVRGKHSGGGIACPTPNTRAWQIRQLSKDKQSQLTELEQARRHQKSDPSAM